MCYIMTANGFTILSTEEARELYGLKDKKGRPLTKKEKLTTMPHYCHDLMHCGQEQCKKKDTCYRYWLGQEIKNTDYQYASFYHPQNKEEVDNCKYYENIEEHR